MTTPPRGWLTDPEPMTDVRNLARDAAGFTSNVFLVAGEVTTLVDVGNEFDVVAAARDALAATEGGTDAAGGPAAVDRVVVTHTHYDHVNNLGSVREAFDPEVLAFDPSVGGVNRGIDDGDTVAMGDHEYLAVHTPGHKDDHLCLYAGDPGVLFAGDLIFANGGFGRTDLEEGDRATLIESIERVLDVVDEDLAELHAGHGPSVTTNPYHDVELALRAATL